MKSYQNKIIRIMIQILFFIWIPESFSVSLYALKTVVHSLCMFQFSYLTEPLIILLGTLIPTILFGRYYCGYICAFGAMQDLSFFIGSRIRKNGKYIVPVKADRILSKIKYIILAWILVCAALDVRIPGSVSPWTSFGNLVSVIKGGFDRNAVLEAGLFILLAVIVISAMFYRSFCRYLCPLGALYSLASFGSYDKRTKKCRNNGACCICHNNCGQYRISYIGRTLTILLFVCSQVYFLLSLNGSGQYFSAYQDEIERGPYQDGVTEGAGDGFRGKIQVKVTVGKGYITSVEVLNHKEDASYMNSVMTQLIPAVLETQSTEVDAISGATYSSKGLLEAIETAIHPVDMEVAEQEEHVNNSVDLDHLEDGVYEGAAIGFRGEIKVAVEIKDHAIVKIRTVSYYDNEEYLFHIAPAVIEEIMENKPLDLDAITGATYSSNGLTRAIEDALQLDENTYEIVEPRPRAEKNKKQHHVVQKFVESDEQYQELIEKYKELMYGPDGKLK